MRQRRYIAWHTTLLLQTCFLWTLYFPIYLPISRVWSLPNIPVITILLVITIQAKINKNTEQTQILWGQNRVMLTPRLHGEVTKNRSMSKRSEPRKLHIPELLRLAVYLFGQNEFAGMYVLGINFLIHRLSFHMCKGGKNLRVWALHQKATTQEEGESVGSACKKANFILLLFAACYRPSPGIQLK